MRWRRRVQQWLGRGRHVWIDVRGRQIHGIATARALASQRAWEIDTLVDAGGEHDGVVTSLLTQASESAAEARVSQLLLRMRADAPALPQALRAGFVRAAQEDLWSAERSDRTDDCDSGDGEILVREAEKADRFALFQLYNRALPIGSRQAIAMTFEEWRAVQERRWLGRGGRELVACEGDKIRAVLQLSARGAVHLARRARSRGQRRRRCTRPPARTSRMRSACWRCSRPVPARRPRCSARTGINWATSTCSWPGARRAR